MLPEARAGLVLLLSDSGMERPQFTQTFPVDGHAACSALGLLSAALL